MVGTVGHFHCTKWPYARVSLCQIPMNNQTIILKELSTFLEKESEDIPNLSSSSLDSSHNFSGLTITTIYQLLLSNSSLS